MDALRLLTLTLVATFAFVSLAPTAAADPINCPSGFYGVVVTQPSGNPYGVCCTIPLDRCIAYRVDLPPWD